MFRSLRHSHISPLNTGNTKLSLSLYPHRFQPHTSMMDPPKPTSKRGGSGDAAGNERRAVAKSTLEVIETGHYMVEGVEHGIRPQLDAMLSGTRYYAPDSLLSHWPQPPTGDHTNKAAEISIVEISTLEGAKLLSSTPHTSPEETRRRVGVLNFACATYPGGGFLVGANAQEESIARSSTLYSSLTCPTGERFYDLHKNDHKGGYYTHAMIFSPNVTVFRSDSGKLVDPTQIDVVTSPAVNARVVRRTSNGRVAGEEEEVKIGKVMKERMSRILFLFEKHGVKDLVLGSFGTGAFQNRISVVAPVWAELLVAPGARFSNSFDWVVFAILGHQTFVEFRDAFEECQGQK